MNSATASMGMLSVIGMAVALSGAPLAGGSAQNQASEEFTAFAINTNTSRGTGPQPARPTTAQLTIRIERWSTDAERDQLLAIVKKDDNVTRMNSELLSAMQRLPRVGFIRGAQTLAWDLRFARQAPLDEGGRRIVIGTDRRMPFWEVRNRPRSFDYPFTIIQMQLDKDNQGEGKLLADTRIFIDPRTNDLVMEHFDLQPVRLNQIRRRN